MQERKESPKKAKSAVQKETPSSGLSYAFNVAVGFPPGLSQDWRRARWDSYSSWNFFHCFLKNKKHTIIVSWTKSNILQCDVNPVEETGEVLGNRRGRRREEPSFLTGWTYSGILNPVFLQVIFHSSETNRWPGGATPRWCNLMYSEAVFAARPNVKAHSTVGPSVWVLTHCTWLKVGLWSHLRVQRTSWRINKPDNPIY